MVLEVLCNFLFTESYYLSTGGHCFRGFCNSEQLLQFKVLLVIVLRGSAAALLAGL